MNCTTPFSSFMNICLGLVEFHHLRFKLVKCTFLRCCGNNFGWLLVVMEILILSRDSFTFSSFTKMIRSDSFTDSFSDHFFILHKYASRWRKRVYYVLLCLNERTVFTYCKKKCVPNLLIK